MIRLQAGEFIGSYRVQDFIARGGFACIYLAEDEAGNKVALKVGDVAGGGRYITRFLEITSKRSPDWISPDETPGEAIFLYGGEEFASLDAFPGLTYRLNATTLELDIDAPVALFDRTNLFPRRKRLPPQGGTGAYLNYDALLDMGDDVDPGFAGVVELVAFRAESLGVLESDVLIESRDGKGNRWFTVGVSPNIVDASFEALLDSINYKLIRDAAPA